MAKGMTILGEKLNETDANALFAMTLSVGWEVLSRVFASHEKQLEHEAFVDIDKRDENMKKIGKVQLMNTLMGMRQTIDEEIRKLE